MAIVGDIREAIANARRSIRAELNGWGTSEFTQWRLQSVLDSIADIMAEAEEDMSMAVQIGVHGQYEKTVVKTAAELEKIVAKLAPFSAVKIGKIAPIVTKDLLTGAGGIRTDLIKFRGLLKKTADVAREEIRRELQIAFLRRDTFGEVARRLTSKVGALKKAERKAFTIARTEGLRARSIGQHDMQKATEKEFGGYFRIWRRWDPVGDSRTRSGHEEARRHPPVLVDQPFMVRAIVPGASDDPGTPSAIHSYVLEPLLFPRDADHGSPANTVTCRCQVIQRAFPTTWQQEKVANEFPVI